MLFYQFESCVHCSLPNASTLWQSNMALFFPLARDFPKKTCIISMTAAGGSLCTGARTTSAHHPQCHRARGARGTAAAAQPDTEPAGWGDQRQGGGGRRLGGKLVAPHELEVHNRNGGMTMIPDFCVLVTCSSLDLCWNLWVW